MAQQPNFSVCQLEAVLAEMPTTVECQGRGKRWYFITDGLASELMFYDMRLLTNSNQIKLDDKGLWLRQTCRKVNETIRLWRNLQKQWIDEFYFQRGRRLLADGRTVSKVQN